MTPEARGRARAERRMAEEARRCLAYTRASLEMHEAAGAPACDGVAEATALAERLEELALTLERMAEKRETQDA